MNMMISGAAYARTWLKRVSNRLDVVEDRYAFACFLALIADEPAEQPGLAARHCHRGMDTALGDGGGQRLLGWIDHVEISCSISNWMVPFT